MAVFNSVRVRAGFSSTFAVFVLSVLLCALVVERQVLAHARSVRSSPANHAELKVAPEKIEVWFNELLDENFNSIEVFAASESKAGKRINLAAGKPVVDAKNQTHLSVSLKPLAPGEYVAEWRVLSRDGHSAPGRITFRVLPLKH